MEVGEKPLRIECGAPSLGPVVLEIGETRLEAGEKPARKTLRKKAEETIPVPALKDYSGQLEAILQQLRIANELLEEIKNNSIPWYMRLYRWFKER